MFSIYHCFPMKKTSCQRIPSKFTFWISAQKLRISSDALSHLCSQSSLAAFALSRSPWGTQALLQSRGTGEHRTHGEKIHFETGLWFSFSSSFPHPFILQCLFLPQNIIFSSISLQKHSGMAGYSFLR